MKNTRDELIMKGERSLDQLNTAQDVLIFGTTAYAPAIATYMEKLSDARIRFVDDTKSGSQFMGREVIALRDADPKLPVISSVIEGRPKTVHHLLEGAGFHGIGSYLHLNLADAAAFPVPFWKNNVADIDAHADKYAWLRSLFADDTSRATLDDVLDLRYNNDFLSGGLTYRLNEQYWEPFIDCARIASFVDGGSFDGNTTLQFIQRNPAFERADVFEPFPDSMRSAQRLLAPYANVRFHERAILDGAKDLHFETGKGSANGLSESGQLKVRSCALDQELEGVRIGMIKLDIEGAEPLAIDGARGIISSQRPVLAICVYHDQSHFWKIPEQVLAIRNDYKVYLRHYTEGIYETVMYFV